MLALVLEGRSLDDTSKTPSSALVVQSSIPAFSAVVDDRDLGVSRARHRRRRVGRRRRRVGVVAAALLVLLTMATTSYF